MADKQEYTSCCSLWMCIPCGVGGCFERVLLIDALLQAASAGVGVELKTLRQQRDGLEDQIQRLEASIARAKGGLLPPRSCNNRAEILCMYSVWNHYCTATQSCMAELLSRG